MGVVGLSEPRSFSAWRDRCVCMTQGYLTQASCPIVCLFVSKICPRSQGQ